VNQTTEAPAMPVRQPSRLKRFIPVIVVAAGFAAFFALGLQDYISFEALRENRAWLGQQVADNALAAGAIFVLLYIVIVAFSLPGGAVMTLGGGFLFGTWLAAGYVVVAATIGATILFLIAKTALGDALEARAGPFLLKMEHGFQENALNYLLVLRLVPLFPFWLVNLVPAFLGVKLSTYVVGTFFGIIPGTVVYASVGNGLGAIFDAGAEPDLGIIFEPQILAPIVGLAVLALIPVVYKKLKARKS